MWPTRRLQWGRLSVTVLSTDCRSRVRRTQGARETGARLERAPELRTSPRAFPPKRVFPQPATDLETAALPIELPPSKTAGHLRGPAYGLRLALRLASGFTLLFRPGHRTRPTSRPEFRCFIAGAFPRLVAWLVSRIVVTHYACPTFNRSTATSRLLTGSPLRVR